MRLNVLCFMAANNMILLVVGTPLRQDSLCAEQHVRIDIDLLVPFWMHTPAEFN